MYSFFNLGARWRWVVNATPRQLCPRGRDLVPIVQEAGWALGSVWKGAENLARTRIRSPGRPARSESLYRLRFPGPPGAHKVSAIKDIWRVGLRVENQFWMFQTFSLQRKPLATTKRGIFCFLTRAAAQLKVTAQLLLLFLPSITCLLFSLEQFSLYS